MTLRYSDSDEVADKEMRQLNLQDAAHTYMMENNAQDSVTPVPFQDPKSPSQPIETEDRYIPDGQNTRLSQVAQKQLAHLPDGSSGFRLQIPYLQLIGTVYPNSSLKCNLNIISGFRILASPKVLQGAFGDSACPMQCSQPCPMLANRHLTGLTWFPIVLYYIR